MSQREEESDRSIRDNKVRSSDNGRDNDRDCRNNNSMSSSEDDHRRRRQRKSGKKRSSRTSSSSDGDNSNGEKDDYPKDREGRSGRRRKHSKKSKHRNKKSKRKYYSDDSVNGTGSSDDSDDYSTSSYSEDSYERDRRRRKRKRKEKRKKKKKKKQKRRRKENAEKDGVETGDNNIGGQFGAYGILKKSDMKAKQRSFEVWLAEVKAIADFNGPKWELDQYFEEYREDFNTATLPHKKYYDYEKWEMEEYQRRQKETADKIAGMAGGGIAARDEARHKEEVKRRAEEKKRKELDLLRASMTGEKVREMKRQAELQSQMQVAFKTGDRETYKRLKAKLEPDEKA